MEHFRVRLEACDPSRGRFRAYRIEAGTDLFGDWLVDVTYGRIGTRGRTVRYLAGDEAGAREIVRRCLQRRATAPRRIGVAYRLTELRAAPDAGPAAWLPAEIMTRLPRATPADHFRSGGSASTEGWGWAVA